MSRRSIQIFAAITLLLAVGFLMREILAAAHDSSPNAWGARWLGLAMPFAAAAVAYAAFRHGTRSESAYWLLIQTVTIAALIVAAYAYVPPLKDIESANNIPLIFGDFTNPATFWTGTQIPPDDETIRVLGTKDIVLRTYTRETSTGHKDNVGAAIVFGSHRKVAHPPEQCYAATGCEFNEIAPDTFDTKDKRTIDVRRLYFTDKNGGATAVIYWYKTGDLVTGSFIRQQFKVMWLDILRKPTRVALVRLSIPVSKPDDREAAFALLKDFAREIFPEVEKYISPQE